MNRPDRAPLVLASASPRRLDLLAQIGIVPDTVLPPAIDEAPRRRERPQDYAARMAVAKAAAVAEQHPGAFVLGADTVVAVGLRILPKTTTRREAMECLRLLSGRRHRVYGGVTIVTPAGVARHRLVRSVVGFKRLTQTELGNYLDSGEWEGKAGGYAIQGKAAALIRFLSGSYPNVVGLPLFEVAQLLHGAGYS